MQSSNLSTTKADKIHYLDNLKILLTVLVVLHHAVITYGAPGSWYYVEKTTNTIALIFMTLFVATNQAFFMGFFFFISALFTEASYNKKGRYTFIKDRLFRLGIPLLFYSVILSPILNYLVERYGYDGQDSFVDYIRHYHHWIDFGVLWFVAALLFFTLIFAMVKDNLPSTSTLVDYPSTNKIWLFSFMLGVISFLVRIYFPIGWTLSPLGFQLGHFPQYIAMFIIGIIAARNKWLMSFDRMRFKPMLGLSIVMVVIVFPLLYMVKELTDSDLENFRGGWHWQSFLYCLWEQMTGISIMASLLVIAKKKWNYSTNLLTTLSRCAFGVYIFHPLILILISLMLKALPINKVFKLLIVAPCAVVITFLLVRLLLFLPGVKKII